MRVRILVALPCLTRARLAETLSLRTFDSSRLVSSRFLRRRARESSLSPANLLQTRSHCRRKQIEERRAKDGKKAGRIIETVIDGVEDRLPPSHKCRCSPRSLFPIQQLARLFTLLDQSSCTALKGAPANNLSPSVQGSEGGPWASGQMPDATLTPDPRAGSRSPTRGLGSRILGHSGPLVSSDVRGHSIRPGTR